MSVSDSELDQIVENLRERKSGHPQAQLYFFNTPKDLRANVSIGSVVYLPVENSEDFALLGCFTQSHWVNQTIFANEDRGVQMITGKVGRNEVCPWHYGERDLRPLIHTSFANLTNVRLSKHLETNETTFQHFASYAFLNPVPSDDVDSLYTPIAVETIINGMLVNGLARTAPLAKPWTRQRNPETYWMDLFAAPRKAFGHPEEPMTAFSPVEEDMKPHGVYGMTVYADVRGFGYSYKSYQQPEYDAPSSPRSITHLYMIALFVYCAVAIVFVVWSIFSGTVSTSWDSGQEVAALALRTPKVDDEVMPTSVLVDNNPLRKRYCVAVAEDEGEGHGRDLVLMPMSDKLGKVPEQWRVKVNTVYR